MPLIVTVALLVALVALVVMAVLYRRQRRPELMIKTIWIGVDFYRPIPHSVAEDMGYSLVHQLDNDGFPTSDPRIDGNARCPINGIRLVFK
jgi:hypothetical protein